MKDAGGGAAAATYSFSSTPKAVTATRKKYREPGDLDSSEFRNPKETNIAWDRRVHRGNTYGMFAQNAIKDALQDHTQVSFSPKTRRKKKEPSPFDIPLPERPRVAVDLSKHLIAKEVIIDVETVTAQTDELLPEPPVEQYQPQKTGVDVHTQVEDGELFDFDLEVDPILDVLVNKTLEQSMMEVEEEHEMATMKDFKSSWYQRQTTMARDWELQVQEEWARWQEKEALMARKREEKKREAQVLLKIQSMAAAKQHLDQIVPTAVTSIQETAFPDCKSMAIERLFLPSLLGLVQKEVATMRQADKLVAQAVSDTVQAQVASYSSSIEKHRQLHLQADRKKYEEQQIRKGKIRIVVDDGSGGSLRVGPIQISTQDSVEEVLTRVYKWLQENEQKLAEAWPHGVLLLINGQPMQKTAEIFEAKAGQISMVAAPEPPPAPPAEAEEGAEEDAEGEAN